MKVFTILILVWSYVGVGALFAEEEAQKQPAVMSLQISPDDPSQEALRELQEKFKSQYRYVDESGQVLGSEELPVWTENHNQVVNKTIENCSPSGNGSSISQCERINFGLDLVNPSDGSTPGFKTNDQIKYEGYDQTRLMHLDLFTSAVGISKVQDKLIEYNIYRLDGNADKAAQVFTGDPELNAQLQDAAAQPERYTGIIGRTASAQQIMERPYAGNVGAFLKDQFFMQDEQRNALIALWNYQQVLTADDSDTSSVYENKIIKSDGRLMNTDIEREIKDGGQLYIPSDAAIEAVKDQVAALKQEGLIEDNSDDPFAKLRDFMSKASSIDSNAELSSLIEERTLQNLMNMRTQDDWGWDRYGVRMINDEGLTSICGQSGAKGFRIPLGENEACKTSYLKGLKEIEPNYENNSEYADPSNGRYSEELHFQKIAEKRASLGNKFLEQNGAKVTEITGQDGDSSLEKLINVLSRDSAIAKFAQIDIRNNPLVFGKATAQIGSKGITEPSEAQKNNIIAKGKEEFGKSAIEEQVSMASASQGLSSGSSSFNASASSPNSRPNAQQSAEKAQKVESMMGKSSASFISKDTTNSDDNGTEFGFASSLGGVSSGSTSAYQNLPSEKRNNLKFFGEALAPMDPINKKGRPEIPRAIGIFCNPHRTDLEDDPKCTCLHGPIILKFFESDEDVDCPQLN